MERQGSLNHLAKRLQERELFFTVNELLSLAKEYAESENTALILGHANFYSIVLIVRGKFPVTIFERMNTEINKKSLRVESIVDLT